MTVNYKTRITDAFIGNATVWTGTAVPFSSSDVAGGQPTAGNLLALQERGDVVQATFKITTEDLRYEGDFADSDCSVIDEALTITGTAATLYGANGKAAWETLSGGRIAGDGDFGNVSGGAYALFPCTIIGVDLNNPGRNIVVSGYRMKCEEISFPFSPSGLTKVSFSLKGFLHSTPANGLGRIFHI